MTLEEQVARALPCAFDDGEMPLGLIPYCSRSPISEQADGVADGCAQLCCPFRYRARVTALLKREIKRAVKAALL